MTTIHPKKAIIHKQNRTEQNNQLKHHYNQGAVGYSIKSKSFLRTSHDKIQLLKENENVNRIETKSTYMQQPIKSREMLSFEDSIALTFTSAESITSIKIAQCPSPFSFFLGKEFSKLVKIPGRVTLQHFTRTCHFP